MGALILALEPQDYWLLVAGAGIGAIAAFVGAFVMLRRARLMEDTPTSRIRSCAQGYAELEGQAMRYGDAPLVAPLTQQPCCWWRFRIERRQRNSNGKGHHWVTVEQGSSEAPFRLVDRTGECVVDPPGARVIPHARQVWHGSLPRPVHGPRSGWGRFVGGPYRYTEERLAEDFPLYAIGAFRTRGGAGALPAQDIGVRELLAKWKRDPKMVALLDVDRSGRLEEREWEAARQMARAQAARESARSALPPDVHVLARTDDGRPFLLSGLPQADLIRRERRQGWAWLAFALAAGALATWALELKGAI